MLLPHVQRALRLHGEFNKLRSCQRGLECALDAFGHAVIGLNGTCKILFSNETGRQLFATADGLNVKGGRLVADLPCEDGELQYRLYQVAMAGKGFSASRALVIHRSSGKPALHLTLMPFARNFLRHITELSVLVSIDDPARKPLSRVDMLRLLFKLSPTEIRLTESLTSSVDLSTAADHLRMSTETPRFHLKSVFKKTGARRQSDLIKLVLNLPGTILDRPPDRSWDARRRYPTLAQRRA